MSCRLDAYRALLEAALKAGYRFVRHQDALVALASGDPRLFFLRHDIDTDLGLTRRIFALERDLGITSTYYFRRHLMDIPLMREIEAFGSEVGYHYEELSDHAKARGIHSREAVLAELGTVQEAFLRNFDAFEQALGSKVHTVAGHGDFVNRRLGVPNTVLVTPEILRRAGITLEAYDKALADRLTLRAADQAYPGLWHPSSPLEAVQAGSSAILVLIHPRHWGRAPFHRFRLDLERLLEGALYRLRT